TFKPTQSIIDPIFSFKSEKNISLFSDDLNLKSITELEIPDNNIEDPLFPHLNYSNSPAINDSKRNNSFQNLHSPLNKIFNSLTLSDNIKKSRSIDNEENLSDCSLSYSQSSNSGIKDAVRIYAKLNKNNSEIDEPINNI